MLTILHVNSCDVYGGAERLISDLMSEQRRLGHHPALLVGERFATNPTAETFDHDVDHANRKAYRAASFPAYEMRGSLHLAQHPLVQSADILHLHNLASSAFHPLAFGPLAAAKPCVWTMHDMQAFTGYCHHSLGCNRWKSGCGACPDLGLPGPLLLRDTTATLWQHKAKVSRELRIIIATPSSWMTQIAKQSLLSSHPVRHVPNGIDLSSFKPGNRTECRRRFGLPQDVPILAGMALFGALQHPFKGGGTLRTVLDHLRQHFPSLVFLNIGGSEEEEGVRSLLTSTKAETAALLSCADVLLYPSIADTAPLAVMEAQACGIPVVASRIGGITDMVSHGRTGFLCEPDDVNAFVTHARMLLENPELRADQSAQAVARATKNFSITNSAVAYMALYKEAIQTHLTAPNLSPILDSIRLESEREMKAFMATQPPRPFFWPHMGPKEFLRSLPKAIAYHLRIKR